MPEFFNNFNWEIFKKPNQSFRNVDYDPNAELNWDAHDWLSQRAENDRGSKYTEQDVEIFNSHVPEYKQIEQNSKSNGTWLQMPDGSRWVGDPREWVMMQSEAFKKNYQENPWYTGQAEWETQVTLPDGTVIDTDKVKRARYHNGEMWFSNDAGYAQYFADTVGREGLGIRGQFINNPNYKTDHNIRGTVFLAGIPKTGNYRKLEGPKTGYDHWRHMPFILTETGFKRTNEKTNLLTDDLVSHSRKLGDDGLFLFNVNDGPVLRNKYKENKILPYFARPGHMNNDSNSRLETTPINEFISQPGFTEKIKFIRGNNGNFDPNTDDKYSAIFKIDSPLFAKKGGRIHIKKKNRGSFTRWCKGKVTAECIARGKKSKDPKIRKRATFAANARKWKHATGGPLRRPNFKESKEAYYDPETDTVFAPDSLGEFYHHEMFHARPNTQLLESLKSYYHNLNDDVLKQMGADLSFVKRFNNDPGHFYSPEELGARIVSASEMLKKMGVKDVTLDFLKNARLNEHSYGDNFRDLLHMFNDENLTKIFNAVKKHENGGILKYQNPATTLDLPEGSVYGGELEPAVVKPIPLYGVLNTYYPVISEFPFTGHSELQIVDSGWDKPLTISKYGTDHDYNLVTNNCSDATRCAVEKIFGEKINPVLFTTPGDVQDFVAEKTGQKPVKEDVGQTALGFNIPFATAMDLKNQNLDFYIQDYLHKAAKMKKQMKEENPNWNSASFDLSTAEVIQRYKDQKYKFQPFKNKNGGILKAQEGTGNLYTPHPLSPVGIALNQAKAIAKMKGEQQYLPPGVKEVVRPDGKKVAIRTEQPLQPLEQNIAEWLPGTGDVAEIGYIANDVKNGNLGSAALAAAMVALPGNVGKLWRRNNLPGLHLQSTMPGSIFEKTLSKDGFINKKTVEQYLSKPDVSVGEKSILEKIQFPENGKMDYNEFRKAVQNELASVQYSQNWRSFEIFDKDFTGYENPYAAYGLDRLGYKLETDPGLGTKYDFSPDAIYNRSITYSNPKLIGGDARHFDYNTLGHTRAFISKAEPDVYHVLESQSDFFQRGDPAKRMWFDPDTGVSNIIRSESGDFVPTSNLKYGLSGDSWTMNEWNRLLENRAINQGDVPSQELGYIYKWWPERQLSESVLNASSNGATKLRYPTRDTAAKIENYEPINVDGKLSYKPEHETILKKYTDFPRISKRAGFGSPIISTDIHGNTWYEIIVPKDFHINGEYRAFKNGGDL